jgi:hypothetical protein
MTLRECSWSYCGIASLADAGNESFCLDFILNGYAHKRLISSAPHAFWPPNSERRFLIGADSDSFSDTIDGGVLCVSKPMLCE